MEEDPANPSWLCVRDCPLGVCLVSLKTGISSFWSSNWIAAAQGVLLPIGSVHKPFDCYLPERQRWHSATNWVHVGTRSPFTNKPWWVNKGHMASQEACVLRGGGEGGLGRSSACHVRKFGCRVESKQILFQSLWNSLRLADASTLDLYCSKDHMMSAINRKV